MKIEDIMDKDEFDLIYKIETDFHGNRCETLFCVDTSFSDQDYLRNVTVLFENGYSFIGHGDRIYIGSKNGRGKYRIEKNKILYIFKKYAKARKWNIKIIYNNSIFTYRRREGGILMNFINRWIH